MIIYCENQAGVEHLAARLSEKATSGDLFALTGDLGAGKSTFARAFIRAFFQDPAMEVPSPTFTLVQIYEHYEKCPVIHTDLYRLEDSEEVYDLGLEEERDNAILLVEWPDRLPQEWHDEALTIALKRPPEAEKGEDEAREVIFGGDALRLKELLA